MGCGNDECIDMDYSKTINLLSTTFPMKADLPTREPLLLKKWEDETLTEKIQAKGKGKPTFLLHDGPPYANGVIHMGHALNKILKDIVVKHKILTGHNAPYKPGWDCHGLPIEHQLFKELGKNKHQMTRQAFREKAVAYAQRFVDEQRRDFKRLGVLGDWDHPYLTQSQDYEANIVEAFFQLWEKGFVYRGLKPGYWCVYDETALAEAEVEYAEKKSDSVYVRFLVKPESIPSSLRSSWDGKNSYVLIWTTTPWTLPANTGLAFHPDEKYVLLSVKDENYVVAEKRKEKIFEIFQKKGTPASVVPTVGPFFGRDLVGLRATNPIHGRETQGVTSDFVTMEEGTGVVHIAPGHGVDDFSVGQRYHLPILSPVGERGQYTEEVGHPELIGKHVLKDANQEVLRLLGENLLFHHTITHSYPHCWRCKNPLIFRATEQWFLRVDDAFRQKLLKEIDTVTWVPAYGVHRIKGMVETRPDWCLSRQRYWGAPIAVFTCEKCHTPLLDKELNKKIIQLIRTKGPDSWYDTATPGQLLSSQRCSKCQGSQFLPEVDILDVWFDSGVSWYAVVEKEFSSLKPETVMYLEG